MSRESYIVREPWSGLYFCGFADDGQSQWGPRDKAQAMDRPSTYVLIRHFDWIKVGGGEND